MILVNGSETTNAPNAADFFAISLAATIIAPLNRPFATRFNQVMRRDEHLCSQGYRFDSLMPNQPRQRPMSEWELVRHHSIEGARPHIIQVERPASGWPQLSDSEIAEREQTIRESTRLEELRDEPNVRAYRDYYWSLGIDPTKKRPSAEALARRILQGKPLPRINPIVDIYNLVSAEQRIAFGGYNGPALQALGGNHRIDFRPAQPGEEFLGIGMKEAMSLTGKEQVLSSGDTVFALFPYRDAWQTRIRGDDEFAVFMLEQVPGIQLDAIAAAEKAIRAELNR